MTAGPWRPDCRCWCQVRPIVCALDCCGCIIHDDHAPEPPPIPDAQEALFT